MKKNMGTSDSTEPDFLRLRVSISKSNPSLHRVLSTIGPYHRVKRLVQLAAIGLAVEEGGIGLVTRNESLPANTLPEQKTSGEQALRTEIANPELQENRHYTIPDNAAEAMGSMFDDD